MGFGRGANAGQYSAEREGRSASIAHRRWRGIVSAVSLVVAVAGCSAPDLSELFAGLAVAVPTSDADAGAETTPTDNREAPRPALRGNVPESPTRASPPSVNITTAGPSAVDAGGPERGVVDGVPDAAAPGVPESSEPVAGPPPPEPVGVVAPDSGDACALPGAAPEAATLFSGTLAGDACRINLDAPYDTFWYSYQDRDGEPALSQGARAPGCSNDTCSLGVRGPIDGAASFSNWGAGVGFELDVGGGPLDASRFRGLQFWARGNIQGARGPGGAPGLQTLLLKIVGTTSRLGDEFGMYCRIDPSSWTLCRQEFSELARDGYVSDPDPRTDVFDPREIVRIEFEFPLFRDAAGAIPTPLRFDVELAAISFF